MQHRGEIIEKAVRESGVSISKLAKRMNKSRQYIYNIFTTIDVNPDVILEIGKIIGHDFTSEIQIFQLVEEPIVKYNKLNEEVLYWKNKYIDLLEKYNKLLEKAKK